jgi:integrase
MADGVEVRGNTVRVYFRWQGELCREPIPGAATEKNIEHARRLATIINYEIDAGTFDYGRHFPGSKRLTQNTFGYYLDLCLAIKENELAYSSFRGIKSKAETHVRPRWGATAADQIDHIELQDWIQKDLAKHLANKTIKEIVSIMRQTFRLYATRNKKAFDPTMGITIRLPDDEDPDPFTRSEIEKILTMPTKRVQELNLIKFALYDGPRISEAQALSWEDVLDVERGIIRYRRAVVRGRFKVTKTKRSTRVHHLLKPAREALQEQYALTGKLPAQTYEIVDRDNRTVRKEKLRLVFLNSMSGKPFYENAIRQRFWQVHLKRAGVRYRGPGQCRHTFISQMLSLGVVPLHWISNHVGHATITMIQRRYGKWIRSDGQDVPAMIEKLLEL